MYKLYKAIYDACDKLEDRVRGFLSHYPIVYAFIGAVGIIVFWRGVWLTMDTIMAGASGGLASIDTRTVLWWDGPFSIAIGATMLLMSGVFVSNFIGNEILISGLRREKKVTEKTEEEIKIEDQRLASVREQIHSIHQQMAGLKAELDEILVKEQPK